MHKALYHRDDVDRLYLSRKEGGRGLTSIEDCIDASIQRLKNYMEEHGRKLITATRNNTNDTRISRVETTITIDVYAANKRGITRENVEVSKKRKP